MANIDYNEILLNAIDAVVVSRIADVNFDRTVTCTIVDATNADSGIYTVNDGSVEFTAESENSKYRKNDCVNVLIPGNDYSNTKTILGKVSKDKDQRPITYVPPTDKIVPMSDNLAVLSTQESLIANGTVQEIELTTHNISTDTLPTINFDTLCVSADFKTLMGDYDMRDGNFGLRVDLITDKNNIYTLLLDSKKDMFGNPYAYSSYFNQEQTYHLNLEENIVRIKTYLYQLGNFKYNDGINTGLANLEPANYDNIFINNVLVTFGYNAEQIEDNTVKIDTPSDKTYNNITNEGLGKKLILTWFNKDENNEYIGFTDGSFGSEEDAKTANKNIYYIKWEHSKNNGSWEPIDNAANLSSFELEVDPTKSINDYRAYVIFNGSSYMSNTVSFRAETGYDSNIKEQLNMALTIEHGENSLDSYPLYGPDSALVNTGESSKPREVYFSYKSSVGGTLEPDILNGATAYLYIPTISTMLEQPYDGWSRKVGENDAANIEGYAAYCKTYIDEFSAQDGENLLRNTAPYELAGAGMGYDYEKQISEWSGNKSVFARATDGGKKTVMLKNTSSSEQVMSAEQKITLKSNTTYTISGSIYPTSAIEPKFILGYSDSNKIETAIEPYANDGTWKHFSITFTTGVVEEKVSIGFSAKIKSKKYVLWYKLMLVEGVKAKEWSYGAGDAEKIKNRAKTFRYRIKDIYNPLFANNEILLKIVDKNGYKYSTTKQFGFSSHGTSGTDYSLIIEDPINKKATLYDANYKPIKTEFADNDWSYWPKPLGQNETRTAAAGYLVRKLTTKVNWVGGDVNLEALKGVSWAPEDSNYYYQGPTTIVYDSNGVNPKYYNGDIGLFDKNTNQLVEGITWALRYYTADKLNKDPLATISINGYPELTQADSGSLPRLKASNMYLTPSNGNEYYLVLVGIKDGNVMWRQPLIITQNQYASSVLNNWDGSLVINQEENTVLTAMVGAGSKNADNEFSGVVMGEFSKLEGDKSIPQSSGLLGFHNGVQSFGFKTNGTAFIGKSGAGRIEFDGDQGFIQSSNFIDDQSGTKLDLDDGSLVMNTTNGEYFKFNGGNNGKLEMKISGADIVLTDKNATLSSHIQTTAEGITSTVASLNQKIQFYCTCNSAAGNAYKGVYPSVDDKTAFPVASEKDFPNGTTIMVKFINGNTAKTIRLGIEGVSGDETGPDGKSGLPVYVGSALDAVPVVDANTSLIFVYDTTLHGWVISESNTYSQIKQTADNIKLSVADGYYNKSEIDIKADSISQRVEGIATDYKGTSTGDLTAQSNGYYFTVQLEGIVDGTPVYRAAPIFHYGTILEVKFTKASSQAGKIRLNVGKIGDEETSGVLGYPIYVNGTITSSTNKFTWSAGSIKYFRFVLTTKSADPNTYFNKGYWEVCDPPYGIGQLITNTQGITGTAIERTGTGFKFNLDSSSFRVGPTEGNAVLQVDSRGLYIDGSGTFTGILKASKIIIQDGADLGGLATTSDIPDVTGAIDGFRTEIEKNYVTTGTLNAWEISANKISAGSLGTDITIGGWKIGANSFYCDAHNGFVGLYSNYPKSIAISGSKKRDDWRIVAGTSGNETFGVTKSGELFCKNANITGVITAQNGGNIGGWEVQEESLYSAVDADHICLLSPRQITMTRGNTGWINAYYDDKDVFNFVMSSGNQAFAMGLNEGYFRGAWQFLNGGIYVSKEKSSSEYTYMSPSTLNFISSSTTPNSAKIQFNSTDLIGFSQSSIMASTRSGRLINTWHSNSAIIVDSDKLIKNSIESQPAYYSRIFDNLTPSIFRYNDGTSNRVHTGLIAQEVEQAVLDSNLTTQEFAAICYDVDEEQNKINYGIRYEELISMCIYEIQQLKKQLQNK